MYRKKSQKRQAVRKMGGKALISKASGGGRGPSISEMRGG
jgi:hypothetical protein